jgi:hypothetical protein
MCETLVHKAPYHRIRRHRMARSMPGWQMQNV